MRSCILHVLWSVCSFSLFIAPTAAQNHDESHTFIYAGRLIDVPGENAKQRQTIIVAGGEIVEVRSGYAPPPEGARTLDLQDMTVLPGLIDAHVHLLMNLGPDTHIKALTQNDVEAAFDGVPNARATLMAGFTTVRDLGGRSDAIFALRDAIATGKIPGPRVLASGLAVTANGGPGAIACSGVDECRRVVRAHILDGADVIKISVTGGTILSSLGGEPPSRFTIEELNAIVETAESMGVKVAAHAHGKASIELALRGGVHSIEHGSYLDNASVRLFRESGAVLVPTLMAGIVVEAFGANPMAPAAFREEASTFGARVIAATARAHRGGVEIVFGTDAGAAVHGDNAQELALLVEAGLSPMEAIRAATTSAAAHLGLGDRIGSIEPGKAADIIAVKGDPLTDITVLKSVDLVMKGGVVQKGETK